MSFLHFEVCRFCMNILFYDFCTNSIEISWYCKFVMKVVSDTNMSKLSVDTMIHVDHI
jgi:hypothetical protein